jgi:hypothetical protein
MANELLNRDDIIRGKKNFDAQNKYMTGTAEEQVTLPDGQKIKTRAGLEKEIEDKFPDSKAGLRDVGNNVGNVVEMTRYGIGNSGLGSQNTNDELLGVQGFSEYNISGFFSVSDQAADSYTDKPTHIRGGVLQNLSFVSGAYKMQVMYGVNGSLAFRPHLSSKPSSSSEWSDVYHSKNPRPYATTTATSANTVVTSTGELQRSTSSKIFKHDIADIDINDYREALKAVRPVSYRSTEATSDRTDWSWYSFIAEELAAIDPRLVQMDSVEFFEDTKEDGTTFINSRELPEGEYAANGINTNGIVALMVHINQQMLADIEKLEDEKTQLKRRTTNLEKRMDAFDGSTPAE